MQPESQQDQPDDRKTPQSTAAPGQVVSQFSAGPPLSTANLESVMVRAEFLSSPYPPPAILGQYNKEIQGSGERLITMVEQESAHRRKKELLQLQSDIEDRREVRKAVARGQFYGFWIGISAIAGSVIMAALGQPWPAGFVGTTGVVGLVSVFVIGRVLPAPKDEASATAQESSK